MSYPGFSTTYKVQTLASVTVVLIAARPVSCPASSFVELSVLIASPNNLRLKNYNGSIAPSQLADAPARDGYSAWSWQETGGPMSLEAVRMSNPYDQTRCKVCRRSCQVKRVRPAFLTARGT
jgi:hypothetical protein